jgi:hypothetical protein
LCPSLFFEPEYPALPCRLEYGKLVLHVEFDRFEWLQGDSGDSEKAPYNGDGEPHAVRAIAKDYYLDITVLSSAAKALLRAGLVIGAPKDAL